MVARPSVPHRYNPALNPDSAVVRCQENLVTIRSFVRFSEHDNSRPYHETR